MTLEHQFGSRKELFEAMLSSHDAGEKRDYDIDGHEFLRLGRIICEFKSDSDIPKTVPVLALPNHYVRPFLRRRSPFTTTDVINATSLILRGLTDATRRKTRWVSKADLTEKIFGIIPSIPRKVQNSMTSVYGNIPAFEGKYDQIPKDVESTLRNGFNVGIYPEGEPPRQSLRTPPKAFTGLIAHLKRKKVNFLVLPISIYFDNSSYHLIFGQTLDPQQMHHRELVSETMRIVASNLPDNLKGECLED